jgi:hypothetical protein
VGGHGYVDTLGVYLDGRNIAWVPGTTQAVSVDTLNGAVNAGYFVNNDIWDDFLNVPIPYAIEFDGFTTRLPIDAAVTPGATHHLKLVIADVGDDTYDSALFIGGLSTRQDHLLQVALDGEGSVRSEPAGIQCGTQCSAPFPYGTQVTLHATRRRAGPLPAGRATPPAPAGRR